MINFAKMAQIELEAQERIDSIYKAAYENSCKNALVNDIDNLYIGNILLKLLVGPIER